MKRAVLFFPVFIMASLCWAAPATSIDMSYDTGKGILHVEATHESFDLYKDYIRLMNVYLNGTQVAAIDYYKQDAFDKFTDDVPLKAQAGDVIKVDLFSSMGGEKAAELKVNAGGPDNAPDNSNTH
jgi:hypothetical protein